MRFPYHDANPADFENFVVGLCRKLLGIGVTRFSTGPDGGRDARFEGTAALWPSEQTQLTGTFIIQAKHTDNPVAKLSDPGFSGESETSVLTKELPRIVKLRNDKELDHYLFFTNRRHGANAEASIRKRIRAAAGEISVGVFGIENIDDLARDYPQVVEAAGLSVLSSPLRVTPDDLAKVITALARQKSSFAVGTPDPIRRTSFEAKNRINGLGDTFAKQIRKEYMRDFPVVRDFLSAPANDRLLERYEEAVAEFSEQVLAYRKVDQPMEQLLLTLQRLLWSRDGDLKSNKRLTKLVIYYMYWVCDLGEGVADAQAD